MKKLKNRLNRSFSSKLKNFRGRTGSTMDSDIGEGIGLDKTKSRNLRLAILEDKEPIRKILRSKKQIIDAAADSNFLEKLDDKYPEKSYSEIIKTNAEAYIAAESDDEKILEEAAKKMGAISRNSKVIESLSDGMEDPGKELFKSLLEAVSTSMQENTALGAKAKLLKSDETGLDSVVEGPVGQALVAESSKEELEKQGASADSIKKTQEKSNTAIASIHVTDEASARKLGESLGRAVHGDNYSQEIFDEIFDKYKKETNNNWDTVAQRLHKTYRSAFHKNMSNLNIRINNCFK